MKDYIKLLLCRNLDEIIIYVGINSLWFFNIFCECVVELIDLVEVVSFEFLVMIFIFGFINRFDDEVFVCKVFDVNKVFKECC